MATISSPGIGSGIDVQAIVSQLVALEKAPLTQLKAQATTFQAKLSAWGTIKAQVSALGDAASKLADRGGWDAVKGSSSNPAAIGVTASAGATPTSFSMEVQQLARSQATATSAIAAGTPIGTGSLSIEIGSWSDGSFNPGGGTPVSVVIEEGKDSLANIAAAINKAGAGVTATVLKDASGERLLMQSTATGEVNGFRISVADTDGDDTDATGLSRLAFDGVSPNGNTLTQTGQNALATINGVPISTASNKLADTLPGMTLQLSQVISQPVTIDVTTDTDAIRTNLKAFVDAYNTLNTTLSNGLRYDAATKKASNLQGDSTATGLQNALRGMMRSVTASAPYARLNDVGISLQTGGALKFDSDRFEAALGNLAGLEQLFTANTGDTATEGFGKKIKAFAKGLVDTEGLVSNRTAALQRQIDRNGTDQEKVEERASRAQVRYLSMYNSMDANVARLNGLNTFVSQQIALWNKG
jgi:flagellar hook-associated protein 2